MAGNHVYVPSRSAEDWAAHLAAPELHWRAERSAYELAHAWQEADGWPPLVAETLAASENPALASLEPLLVMAERSTELPGKGHESQSDALVIASGQRGLAVVIVEGKEREGFDEVTADWLADGGENRERRFDGVCQRIGLEPNDRAQQVRWQLLHRTAASVIEADKFGVKDAVMLVHSFSATRESFGDYSDFLSLYGKQAEPNRVYELTTVGQCTLHAGWVADKCQPAADAGTAEDVFKAALAWLESHYKQQGIYNERDVERALQARMKWIISERRLPLRVFHGHPMALPSGGRRLVDLALLDEADGVELVVELKFEPSKERSGRDLSPGKFPVVEWKAIAADVARVDEWVETGAAQVGYAVLIDEGGLYRSKPVDGKWLEWPKSRTGFADSSVLVYRSAGGGARHN